MCRSVPDNLVLIGFSGTGKSSVGRILAARLGWPAVDTDQLIVQRFGRSIAEVFRDEGEAVFRAVEREVVAACCRGSRQVVSLGGGAPVDPTNRAAIRRGNVVVRLAASPETILARLRGSPGAEERPLLAGADPLGKIRTLLAERETAYAIADLTIDTEERSPAEVAELILAACARRGVRPSAAAPG